VSVSLIHHLARNRGRATTRPRQVLDAPRNPAAVFRGNNAYIMSLAGYSATTTRRRPHSQTVTGPHEPTCDALPSPACACRTWAIRHGNTAYEALYPNVATVARPTEIALVLIPPTPSYRTVMPMDIHQPANVSSYPGKAGDGARPDICHLVGTTSRGRKPFSAGGENTTSKH